MKTKLLKRTPMTLILCLVSVLPATTMTVRAAAPAPTMIDPVTGLAILPTKEWKYTTEEWTDPNWKDPDIRLKDVGPWDYLPLSEVARVLQDQFKNYFDVLLPDVSVPSSQYWQNPVSSQSLTIAAEYIPVTEISMKLHLRNVTASEVFNAMNLLFETENAPVRWQLLLNGNRPTAVLRVLPELLPVVQPSPAPEPPKKERQIVFVGDLLGDPKSGGMTLEQMAHTVLEVCSLALDRPTDRLTGLLKFHKEAQLLIITGTRDEIQVVNNAISALSSKLRLEKSRRMVSGESKPKSDETKTP